MIVKKGATRTVLLVGKYAIKLPGITGHGFRFHYQSFLRGLLANMQEKLFHSFSSKYCPVVFYIPGGFCTVMKRAEPLTEDIFMDLRFKEFMNEGHLCLIGENKISSFGLLNNEIVIVDYGN